MESWIAHFSYGGPPVPARGVNNDTLRTILAAIRESKAIEVKYQSLSSDDPRWRWISPHAIGSMASGGTLVPSVRLMVPQGFFAVTHHGDQINSSERCVA
jgi:hypothetical protein